MNKARLFALSISIQYSALNSSWTHKKTEEHQKDTSWKVRSQSIVFTSDMRVYISNPQISNGKLLQLKKMFQQNSPENPAPRRVHALSFPYVFFSQ